MASNDMGKLLLQGWAMLEECCCDCNVPLMRSPKKDQEICVQCGKDYKAKEKKPDLQRMNDMKPKDLKEDEKQKILAGRRAERLATIPENASTDCNAEQKKP